MGELYEVLGALRFSPQVPCPPELLGVTLRLACNEGFVFSIPAPVGCVSGAVRREALHALQSGVDPGATDIPVPLRKSSLNKVIDYMKHHKENKASEIVTPLISNDLVECGVSRWDAKFVDVDKAVLFDMNLAASILDIAGLFFLTSAKVAMLMRDKAPERLRKEFNLLNDLPKGEEEAMARELDLAGLAKHDNPACDIASLAATLQATAAAAEKQGCLDTARDGSGVPAVDIRSWRHATWRAATLLDWNQLAMAPPEVQADRDLVMAALMVSQGEALRYAAPALRADQPLVLEAVKYSGAVFCEAAEELRSDREFVLQALASHPASLAGASQALRGDRDLLLEAARQGLGAAFEGALDSLRSDAEFALELVKVDPQAFRFVADPLREDRHFALRAAAVSGRTLRHMSPSLKADAEVVAIAIGEDAAAVLFAHTSRRGDLGVGLPWDGPGVGAVVSALPGMLDPAPALKGQRMAGIDDPEQVYYWNHKVQKSVQFSAMSVMTGNVGQANYVAADIWLDKLPPFQRPQVDAVTLMWGAVGHIGMRWKAFASADFLNNTPDALLTIPDASKVLHMTCCRMDPPEWYCATHLDQASREGFLTHTAGAGSGGHWVPAEASEVSPYPVVPPDGDWSADGLNKGFLIGRDLEDERAPLGGWPSLAASSSARHTHSGVQGRCVEASRPKLAPPAAAARRVPLEGCVLEEGGRAELTGLDSKAGATGILLKRFADGKWKVRLDDGTGNALLKCCYLRALEPASEAGPAVERARQARLEPRRCQQSRPAALGGAEAPQLLAACG